jgi:hypothetical protein
MERYSDICSSGSVGVEIVGLEPNCDEKEIVKMLYPDDEWCEFCGEKLKTCTVKINEKIHWVCYQCKSLTVIRDE